MFSSPSVPRFGSPSVKCRVRTSAAALCWNRSQRSPRISRHKGFLSWKRPPIAVKINKQIICVNFAEILYFRVYTFQNMNWGLCRLSGHSPSKGFLFFFFVQRGGTALQKLIDWNWSASNWKRNWMQPFSGLSCHQDIEFSLRPGGDSLGQGWLGMRNMQIDMSICHAFHSDAVQIAQNWNKQQDCLLFEPSQRKMKYAGNF